MIVYVIRFKIPSLHRIDAKKITAWGESGFPASFLGYTKPEVATIFGVTVRTIERDLAKNKTKTNKGSAT